MKTYQVLTNYNVNHPELGGYPCWRYETAMEMFSEGEHDIYQMGFILAATHQEAYELGVELAEKLYPG